MGYRAAIFAVMSAVCATAAAADPAPFATIHLDVAPGQIQRFTSDLDEADDQGGLGVGMTVRFAKTQPSVRWSPLFALCATATDPARSECLRVTVDVDKNVLQLESSSQVSGGKVATDRIAMTSQIGMSEVFRAAMRVDKANTLTFSVNGRDVLSRVVDFAPKQFAYACSSLACDLTLADLAAPKAEAPMTVIRESDLAPFKEGQDALAAGNYDLAIEKFSRVIDAMPFVPLFYVQRASAWMGKSDRLHALADLDQALSVDASVKVSDSQGGTVAAMFALGDARQDVEAIRDQIRARIAAAATPSVR